MTVFALEIVFDQPARELFAGSYDTIRASVQRRALRMMKQLKARQEKHPKKTPRKLQLLTALVEAKPNAVRRD